MLLLAKALQVLTVLLVPFAVASFIWFFLKAAWRRVRRRTGSDAGEPSTRCPAARGFLESVSLFLLRLMGGVAVLLLLLVALRLAGGAEAQAAPVDRDRSTDAPGIEGSP
jgi:hypothetical protein